MSSSGSVDPDEFVSFGNLRARALARTVFGSVLLAWASGVIRVTQAIGEAWTMLFGGVQGFASAAISEWFGIGESVWTTAWQQVPTDVGALSFFVVVGIVLAVGYLFARGLDYALEVIP